MHNNGLSPAESSLAHEVMPLDKESYWALVTSAYETANAEGFDATGFVDEKFQAYKELTTAVLKLHQLLKGS